MFGINDLNQVRMEMIIISRLRTINSRIAELVAESNLSEREFAEVLSKESGKTYTRSTINNWLNGNYNLKSDDIVALADAFGVSCDWLLGKAPLNVSSPDEQIKSVCEYTGLSQSTVEHLHTCVEQLQKDNSYFDILNALLSNDDFYHSIAYLKRAKRVEAVVSDQKQANLEGFNMLQSFAESFSDREVMSGDISSGVRLSHRQSIDFYLQCASDCFKRLCHRVVKGDEK